MLAFQALVESSTRVNAAKTIEEAWIAMGSAQAAGKDMEKLLKPYKKLVGLGKPKKNDAGAFISAWRKGKGGK